jgi:hydroxyacyl-ACP dehydratase HTD2-like protein with hotdog domain
VDEEAYPERVVHGPLIALLMLEHLRRRHPKGELRAFSYKAMAPTFCGEDVTVSDSGRDKLQVVARNGAGADAVLGEATYGA